MVISNQEKASATSYIMHFSLDLYHVAIVISRFIFTLLIRKFIEKIVQMNTYRVIKCSNCDPDFLDIFVNAYTVVVLNIK